MIIKGSGGSDLPVEIERSFGGQSYHSRSEFAPIGGKRAMRDPLLDLASFAAASLKGRWMARTDGESVPRARIDRIRRSMICFISAAPDGDALDEKHKSRSPPRAIKLGFTRLNSDFSSHAGG